MPNRLAAATSPYLLQHQDNPVDWWPWCDEAFEQARQRDVPVLLSVGYAACHWCHVMAHESFEDAGVAGLMNEAFVNVKVDREERPDVDAVYMNATQALTGHGGWPMTVFLTPDGRPFYAGTYFPPRPRQGMPSFPQVLDAVSSTWRQRRDDVEQAGTRIAAAVGARSLPPGERLPGPEVLAAAVHVLAAEQDRRYGGFGGAPKFPPSMACEFLLRHAAARRLATDAPDTEDTEDTQDSGELALQVAAHTLTAMARSGIYDQVGGGFARYAVDAAWVVPHFEKMLYDNAQLARVYLHWWRLTGEPTGARIALETCDWMLAALGTQQGGLASSLDADTEGVEGSTYVWTPEQLEQELGEDAGWAAELLRVTPAGTFEHGASTLQLDRDAWADAADAERWRRLRERLRKVRDRRPQPGRDDKVVAAWNGLGLATLAETGALLGRDDLVTAAERVADLLLTVHRSTGPDGVRLRRVSRNGTAGEPAGVLEDYGDVCEGLLALHAVTGSPRWLEAAGELLDVVLGQFTGAAGAFFDTPADATDAALVAVGRPADPTDNAYPSGWSAAAGALLSYAALTGSARHRDAAHAALARVSGGIAAAPHAFGWAMAVCEAAADGPREIAVAGPDGDPGREHLHRVALAATAPGAVVSAGPPDAVGIPLLAGKGVVDGAAAAYVCRNFRCDRPTTHPAELAVSVGARQVIGAPGC